VQQQFLSYQLIKKATHLVAAAEPRNFMHAQRALAVIQNIYGGA
jgi:hypothetical protein